MAVNDATVDLLAAMNLKPYVIQQQPLARFGDEVWDIYRQFDTLDDAKAAFRQLPAYGKIRYRVAEARPHISYDPVLL